MIFAPVCFRFTSDRVICDNPLAIFLFSFFRRVLLRIAYSLWYARCTCTAECTVHLFCGINTCTVGCTVQLYTGEFYPCIFSSLPPNICSLIHIWVGGEKTRLEIIFSYWCLKKKCHFLLDLLLCYFL